MPNRKYSKLLSLAESSDDDETYQIKALRVHFGRRNVTISKFSYDFAFEPRTNVMSALMDLGYKQMNLHDLANFFHFYVQMHGVPYPIQIKTTNQARQLFSQKMKKFNVILVHQGFDIDRLKNIKSEPILEMPRIEAFLKIIERKSIVFCSERTYVEDKTLPKMISNEEEADCYSS